MMYMALLSEEMSVQQRADYAMRFIQPVLSTVEGVGPRVLGYRQLRYAHLVEPDEDGGVRRYGSRRRRRRAPRQLHLGGRHDAGRTRRASVDAETDLDDPNRFAAIVVRQDGDRRVTLEDVAKVELASETYESAVYSSGKETVFISITEAPAPTRSR